MRVTLRLLDYMEASQFDSLRDALELQRGPGGIITRADESRWRLSTEPLELIGRLRELSPSEVLARMAGRYLASGEQRGRRGDLDGAEKDYARALELYTRVQDDLGLANAYAARSALRAHGADVSGVGDTARSDELLSRSKDRLPTPDDVRGADVRPEQVQDATPFDAGVRTLLLSGDNERAMRSLVRAYQGVLYSRALRLTHSNTLAEEAVQETWIAAVKNLDKDACSRELAGVVNPHRDPHEHRYATLR